MENLNAPQFRGLYAHRTECTAGSADWREKIDIGPEQTALETGPDDPDCLRLIGPNQWPSGLPELRYIRHTPQHRRPARRHRSPRRPDCDGVRLRRACDPRAAPPRPVPYPLHGRPPGPAAAVPADIDASGRRPRRTTGAAGVDHVDRRASDFL
ncbi:hypothetical protein [Streptomyces sp. NPDC051677]|uniref:hypothetical protein n=1 Tax=Streptomyces sp. NPDC051677 TaxID=3365669 RepID=UPI0037D210CE